jgi:hypothetical protein
LKPKEQKKVELSKEEQAKIDDEELERRLA